MGTTHLLIDCVSLPLLTFLTNLTGCARPVGKLALREGHGEPSAAARRDAADAPRAGMQQRRWVVILKCCRLRPVRTAQQGRVSARWWHWRGPTLRGNACAVAHARAADGRTYVTPARYARLRRRASVSVPAVRVCKECKECKEVQRPDSPAASVPAVRFVRNVSNVRLALGCCGCCGLI
jgi:hypothetical protein